MKERVSRALGLFVLAILFSSVAAHAELYMKVARHVDAFTIMGQTQPEKNETVVYWFGKDQVRIDTGESQSAIILLDKKMMYIMDHPNKSYSEIPVDIQKAIEAATAGTGEENSEQAKEMAKKMSESIMKGTEVKVKETGETKKIKDWECRKYVVDLTMPMGKSQGVMWATESIKVDPQTYWTAANGMLAAQPGFEKILDEMKKIKGVVVDNSTTATVMDTQVKSTENLVEIAEKAAPAGSFDLPKDYKKVDRTMMR